MNMRRSLAAIVTLAIAGCGAPIRYIPGGVSHSDGQTYGFVVRSEQGEHDRVYLVRCSVSGEGDASCAWHRIVTGDVRVQLAGPAATPQ